MGHSSPRAPRYKSWHCDTCIWKVPLTNSLSPQKPCSLLPSDAALPLSAWQAGVVFLQEPKHTEGTQLDSGIALGWTLPLTGVVKLTLRSSSSYSPQAFVHASAGPAHPSLSASCSPCSLHCVYAAISLPMAGSSEFLFFCPYQTGSLSLPCSLSLSQEWSENVQAPGEGPFASHPCRRAHCDSLLTVQYLSPSGTQKSWFSFGCV